MKLARKVGPMINPHNRPDLFLSRLQLFTRSRHQHSELSLSCKKNVKAGKKETFGYASRLSSTERRP
jgi:hypothetical protein